MLAVALLTLLGACDGGSPTEPTAAETPADPSRAQQANGDLAPAATAARATSDLARAIGPECGRASMSLLKGTTGGQEFYAVRCAGGDYLVSVKPDGSTRVLECAIAEAMKTPCWSTWQ